MIRHKNLPAIGLGMLLAACLVAWFTTRDPAGGRNETKPPAAINQAMRPSVNRLDVNVRYITRAPQRYEVKSRLFEKVVEMLHRSSSATKSV